MIPACGVCRDSMFSAAHEGAYSSESGDISGAQSRGIMGWRVSDYAPAFPVSPARKQAERCPLPPQATGSLAPDRPPARPRPWGVLCRMAGAAGVAVCVPVVIAAAPAAAASAATARGHDGFRPDTTQSETVSTGSDSGAGSLAGGHRSRQLGSRRNGDGHHFLRQRDDHAGQRASCHHQRGDHRWFVGAYLHRLAARRVGGDQLRRPRWPALLRRLC